MMIDSETFYFYLLLMSNALLLAAAAIAVLQFHHQFRRGEQFWRSPTGASVAEQETQRARQQLLVNMRLEKQLSELQKKIDSLSSEDHRPTGAAERLLPMDNALQMARHGASVEDISRNCGLNIGEAQLMQKLHGRSASVAPA